jgi:hypothetical protein
MSACSMGHLAVRGVRHSAVLAVAGVITLLGRMDLGVLRVSRLLWSRGSVVMMLLMICHMGSRLPGVMLPINALLL